MAHRVLAQARAFAHPLLSNELWIIIPNSKALKHTHWSFWFWTFSFWSLWTGTAIQCQSYPESVCTKTSSAQRQCQRVKAVLRSFALSKKKGDSRAELALGPHRFRWGATRLLLRGPRGQEQAAPNQVGFNNLPWRHHHPVPQLSHTSPERTGRICNKNSAHTCPDGTLASSRIPIFLADLHPPGRKRQTLEW